MPNPVEAISLADALKSLGATQEFQPVPLWRSRIFWLAEVKTGKTTTLCSWPGALIEDLEGKTDNIPFKRAGCVKITDYQSLESQMRLLEQKRATLGDRWPIRHIVFDSMDRLQEICRAQIVKEENAGLAADKTPKDFEDLKGGKGAWAMLADRVMSFPRRMYKAGYGWSMVGHVRREKVTIDKQEVERPRPCCTPLIYGAVYQDAEILCTLTKRIVRKGLTFREVAGHQIPTTSIDVVEIVLEAQQRLGATGGLNLGSQIELPTEIVLPPVDAMSVVEREYEAAIARKLAEVENRSKTPEKPA